ncbi:MAG TPA: cytochrome P450, partial [Acidimicrobiia bacterium]|nr:cytochrome P450 [Acidimicrobiia bacterium]
VTRHEEARSVLRDTEHFSNASGMKAPGVVIPVEDRLLGELDPPRHTLVRRVMVTAMTPKVVHQAEPFIVETARGLLASAPPVTFDLVAAYTVLLPNRVTAHLLGLPPEDADQLARWAKELMESSFPAMNRTDRGEGFAAAFPEFAAYIDDRVAERTAQLRAGEPRTDVLARLVELQVDGAPLPHRQVRALVRNLITGGLTTTSQLLGNLLHELLARPDVEHAVRADLALLDNAIEESLRLAPPILFLARSCVGETAVGGCPVHQGERVIVGTASANRDERVFEDGSTFRLDRDNADAHLTFGFGSHVCPGATLARRVARLGVEVFLDHFPEGAVRLQPGFTFEQVPTYFEFGPRRLPVVVGDVVAS